jgi:D-proline reductase (dithiol) PrdB
MADVKPLEMSRYCVPFTPFKKALEESTICLVTTAAVRHKDDTPFNVEGDTTFRTILSSTEGADLRYDDAHYDHACIDQDINCVFPLDRLRSLADEKRIGGLAEQHFSLGFSQALRELRETTVPAVAREVERLRPDAVLLTGG